ncbi:MAG: murein L,D-transpeptidase catalytic domain family protein [Chitinophagaceae bacterium]|nr:murein L,D-transpeptidase catalytic domain family protein [Chitinophagaceae bacterium]
MKRSGLILFTILTSAAYLPLVSAKSKASVKHYVLPEIKPGEDSLLNTPEKKKISNVSFLYDNLQLGEKGLSRQAFEYAMQGFEYLKQNGDIDNDDVISIVDFSLPSSAKRLFVIDRSNNKILYYTYVAHGHNSGLEYANQFSNQPESNKSSLGFYKTLSTYMGDNGYSLRLEGLEKGINDNANRRDIVIHGAAYVSEGLIRTQGYIGRSWGCPALPEKLHKPIIDKIKNGSCLFIYAKDKAYQSKSRILKATLA